jgi:hypothetical protein
MCGPAVAVGWPVLAAPAGLAAVLVYQLAVRGTYLWRKGG